ncbi:Vps54-domain-containing protein [Didymella exigua CBS 183.55]|uniref:Vps54-domain-containing protein n=1 Tax=Didymella exigua CBS 183.55 TaxID=1150837 RepID=A0A6A5RKQ9_9PLEO|nr:Vps54-domain-containing protein [Didymella exigua CBS 183.55]KAF1928229.1 Vps54-domain-containing protein [Didymella exigua CBS 183.55]
MDTHQWPRRSTESFEFLSPTLQQSQYPFPPHDWTSRPSSTGGRHQPRRGSTASSMHSVGGVLDAGFKALSEERGPTNAAIATLLTPPVMRTGMLPYTAAQASSGHRPPSTRDIPPVTLTNIAHVEPAAFNAYLSQIGTLYDAFQRAQADADAAAAAAAAAQQPCTEPQPASTTPSPAATPSGAPKARRRQSGSKRGPPAVTPLSTIPGVYFDESFRLENPRTFDIVSERSEVVRPVRPPTNDAVYSANGTAEAPPPSGRKALATNAILQEKLSWYMDTVEVHLISAISTASTSFFAALGSLRELQTEAAESVAQIKELREDLRRLDEQMAIGGLRVVGMKRRRENLRRLTDAVDQLQAVIYGVSHCDESVEKGELEAAAARLVVIERLITGVLDPSDSNVTSWLKTQLPRRLIDLRGLRALDGIFEGMGDMKFRIGRGFEVRFLDTLLADLGEHIKNVPSRETLERWVAASTKARGAPAAPKPKLMPAYLTTSTEFRSKLRASLHGLNDAQFTNQAAATFREAIVKEMKMIIRRYLPSSTDDDAESMTSVSTRGGRGHSQQDKNSILARNLRAMDAADAEDFFTNIFTDIGEALRRLSTQVKVLLDVTSGVSTPPASAGGLRSPPKSPYMQNIDSYMEAGSNGQNGLGSSDLQMELMQALDLSSLLGQAVDAAQTQITKLLRVRSAQSAELPLERFLRYFKLCRLFADECEAISGRSGSALKSAVNDHITAFVQKFSDFEKQELAKAMDSDRWEPKDFDVSDTEVLARLLGSMDGDPPNWAETGSVLSSVPEPTANGTNGATEAPKEKSKTTTPAIVDEEKYTVSASSTFVLRGIERHLILLSHIPSMTSDISVCLCEYIKLFNSRLCQLILGAGAMATAGLKNINTKHLAIASQTLSFIIAVVPYIRECARRRAGPTPPGGKPVGTEFDNTKRLLQDQQGSIHDKLTDILSGRATVHMRALKKVVWDEDAEVKRDVSAAMESLTKDTVTMHKVINRYLGELQVRMIMGPVFESYREQVGKVIKEAGVKTPGGKARLVREAKLFEAKLGPIDGAGNVGKFLMQLAEGKPVAQPAADPEPRKSEEKADASDEKADASDEKADASDEKADASDEKVEDKPEQQSTATL